MLLGARVIVTSSRDQKLERAKELGSAAVINYKTMPNWPKAVVELTGGIGADYVVDTVGDLKQSIAAVRLAGTVAFVGLLIGMTAEVDLVTFMGKSARVEAVDVGSREMFEAMNKAITFHAMRPVVDRVFAFTELREALAYLREARHFGKVCLRA
jgi:NADPH:quinone reductase-like Zn-dependent oxidoreductase